jgi:hypothetical protein
LPGFTEDDVLGVDEGDDDIPDDDVKEAHLDDLDKEAHK